MFFLNILPNSELSIIDSIAHELMLTNETAEVFGLTISQQAAREIVIARQNTLKEYDRIELDTEILQKIIINFCTSPYLQQSEYMDTIIELLELFHYIKNELDDDIGDDTLIEMLRDLYNNKCFGDLELLKGRETENVIRQYRFEDDYDQESDSEFDEADQEYWEDTLWDL